MRNYFRNGFVVFPCNGGYVVYNLRKEFEDGHSHLKSFKAAKDAITFVTKKIIPKDCRFYYLTTLKRLATDNNFIKQIDELICTRQQKGKKQNYCNRPAILR